jgi:hypothetical protein
MYMQDKYAIGPVTIVQLVGLNAKPRIASAKIDASVRAADPLPPASAAAGFGDDGAALLADVDNGHFDLKVPASIALAAPQMRANISLEGSVDRPVSSSSSQGNNTASDPDDIDLAGLLGQLNGGANPPSDVPELPAVARPDAVEVRERVFPETEVSVGASFDADGLEENDSQDAVFDGAEAFGDDKILDFEAYYVESGLATVANGEAISGNDFSTIIAELPGTFVGDAAFDLWLDNVADSVADPEFLDAIDLTHSSNDAVPLI